MAIDTMDKLVAGLASRQTLMIYKASLATQSANGFTSLWRATGNPSQGAIPSTAATCNSALLGGWPFVNPGSGNSYLAGLTIQGAASHQLIIYDRLSHMGGLSGTTTTAQTVGISIPASRNAVYTDPDLEWFCEIYTDIGTSGQTATVAYVDEADGNSTFTFTLGGTSPLNQDSRLFPLNSGTTNLGATKKIKSITSVTHATTGTAGSYGFTCAKRLASVNMGQINVGMTYDFAGIKLPLVPNNACIWFAILASNATTGIITGDLTMVQG
jgi:hypothetical protein